MSKDESIGYYAPHTFQLTYEIRDSDPFLHQISQFGAQFITKGPEAETWYHTPHHQLRLDEGVDVELTMVKLFDHYQEIFHVGFKQTNQMKHLLAETLGERSFLTKQVIRYYLKNILIEIHRFDKISHLLYLQAETLNQCKDLARQLSLNDRHRINKTSADLASESYN